MKRINPGPLEAPKTTQSQSSELKIEVGPTLRGTKRTVRVLDGTNAVHRDEISIDSHDARVKFFRDLRKTRELTDADVERLQQQMIDRADEVDAEVDEASQSTVGDTLTERLVNLVDSKLLFKTGNDIAYAEVGHICMPFKSEAFARWIRAEAHSVLGVYAKKQTIEEAIAQLEAIAVISGPAREVAIRVDSADEKIYFEIGRPDGKVAIVTAAGYKIQRPNRARFTRPKPFLPFPAPRTASKEKLREFFNLLNMHDRRKQALFLGTQVGMFFPRQPQPVMCILGPPVAAKSTLTKCIKSLVDPTKPASRSLPASPHDLMIAANGQCLLAFDNISKISDQISDAICQITSGAGMGTRELIESYDEALFDALRPVLLNGMSGPSRRDIWDRAVVFFLGRLKPSEQKMFLDVEHEFELLRPFLLDALLKGVSMALRDRKEVRQRFQGQWP